MTKFKNLDRRPARGAGGRPSLDAIAERNRARERAAFIERAEWPLKDFTTAFGLSDAEMIRMLEKGAEHAARGIVEKHDADYVVRRFGWHCLANGWSIVPQERYGKRAPSVAFKAHGEQKFPFRPTEYRRRRMDVRDFVYTAEWHPMNANLAIQCCEASSHIRVIDVDCRDPDTATAVMNIAFEVLGVTPFVRYGARPKLQLIYRIDPADAHSLAISKWTAILMNKDGTPNVDDEMKPINAVEFLAQGAIFTAYGIHYKTDEPFSWASGALHPAMAGPEHAPVITKALLRAFVNRLQSLAPMQGNATAGSNPHGGRSEFTEFDRRGNGKIWVPRLSCGQWQIDAEGYVKDGAEQWLSSHVWALCAANAGDLRRLMPTIEDYLTAYAGNMLSKYHRDNASLAGADAIQRQVRQKLKYTAEKWYRSIETFLRTGRYEGGIVPWGINEDGSRPTRQRITPGARPADGSLDWIPDETCPIEELAEHIPSVKVVISKKTEDQTLRDAWDRALIEDLDIRDAITKKVSADVRSHVRGFLNSISDIPFHLLKAPTGAGKTVGFWSEVAEFCRENPRFNTKGEDQGPILFVVPSHANANESMLTAERNGLFSGEFWSEDDVESIQNMVGRSVRVERLKGRTAEDMCGRVEELKMLSKKGIGASGLCEKKVDAIPEHEAKLARREGKKVEQVKLLCPIRAAGDCAYYNQMEALSRADVIVVTHAYLTQHSLPPVIEKPRAVIIDESITYAALGQARLPLWAFDLPRKMPYVTQADRQRWPDQTPDQIAADYFGDREQAAAIAKEALLAKKDPASVFLAHPRGRALVESAKLVCERSHDADRAVRPDLSPAAVKEIADKETARHLLLEKSFWRTVGARMDAVAEGTARGHRDMLLQTVEHYDDEHKQMAPHVRISWRSAINWSDRPILLLDASANPRIMSKIVGRTPDVKMVDAPLHVRTVASIEKTWSTSSFIPAIDATDDERAECARNIAAARALITTTAVVYGYGRVLVGTTMKVREILTDGGWCPPANVDFSHFGALRGLDFAKHHCAAISIGRTEQPISIIDGYAAALTYDDDVPEEPYDRNGTGLTDECRPLFRKPAPRTMLMRTGQDVRHNVPEMPGKMVMGEDGKVVLVTERGADGKPYAVRSWAQDLEESWREEELRQFLGRLRPVFRGIAQDADGNPINVEPPVWLCIGKIRPPGIVIDEVVEVAQLIKPAPITDMIRLADGVFDEHAMPAVPVNAATLAGRTIKQFRGELMPHRDSYIRRLVSAMIKVRYRVVGEERVQPAYIVPTWIEGDAGEHFKAFCERTGVGAVEIVSVEPAKRQPTGQSATKVDKVDARLDSRESRLAAELLVRSIGLGEGMSPTEVELRLLDGQRVCGIALDDVEPEYDAILADRYVHNQTATDSFEDYWGGYGETVGGVPIDA